MAIGNVAFVLLLLPCTLFSPNLVILSMLEAGRMLWPCLLQKGLVLHCKFRSTPILELTWISTHVLLALSRPPDHAWASSGFASLDLQEFFEAFTIRLWMARVASHLHRVGGAISQDPMDDKLHWLIILVSLIHLSPTPPLLASLAAARTPRQSPRYGVVTSLGALRIVSFPPSKWWFQSLLQHGI